MSAGRGDGFGEMLEETKESTEARKEANQKGVALGNEKKPLPCKRSLRLKESALPPSAKAIAEEFV